MPDRLINAQEAADILQVPLARVYDLVRRGELPHIKVGRQVRFSPKSLDAWIAGGGTLLPGGWRRRSETDDATV